MPVGCEGVPGAGGARDKWTSRVYRPRLPAGEETPLRVCTLLLYLGFPASSTGFRGLGYSTIYVGGSDRAESRKRFLLSVPSYLYLAFTRYNELNVASGIKLDEIKYYIRLYSGAIGYRIKSAMSNTPNVSDNNYADISNL